MLGSLPNTIPFASQNPVPISEGFITAQNGHLFCGGSRCILAGVNFTGWVLTGLLQWNGKAMVPNPAGRDVFCAQLDNFVNMGFNAVRLNDADRGSGNNWFCAGNGPPASTRVIDPSQLEAFDFLMWECGKRGVRVFPTLYQRRTLTANDAPSWQCDSFAEMLATKYGPPWPATTGSIHPWCVVDDGALQFNIEFATQLLTHVNPYTGVGIGKDPTLGGVTLQNERSITRDGFLFDWSAPPVFTSKMMALMEQWAAANSIPWKQGANAIYSLDKPQLAAFLAAADRAMLMKFAAAVRQCTPALVIAGTGYGDAPWYQLVGPAAVGDMTDFHFYSRNKTSDPNGFLEIPSGANRTPFAAAAAGYSYGNKPRFCTELGSVAQASSPLASDSDSERAQEIGAIVDALIVQDYDAMFWYAGGWHAFGTPGNDKIGVYDLRADAVLLRGIQYQLSRFKELDLRSGLPAAVSVSPTNGLYGAGAGPAYACYGPTSDPAILAVPYGTPVTIQR